MTDITQAQFADFPNVAGRTTFSYAELLAQLQADLAFAGSGVNGALISGAASQMIPDSVTTPLDFSVGGTTIRYEDGGTWFNPVSGTLLVIPSALLTLTSRVQVFGYVEWVTNTVGHRFFFESSQTIGTFQQTTLPVTGVVTRQSGTSAMRRTLGVVGTYSLSVLQTSGAPLAISRADFGVRIVQA